MNIRSLFAAIFLLIGATAIGSAQPPAKEIRVFNKWAAYTSDQSGKMCFAASQPEKSEYSKSISGRDPVFFMVTTFPEKKIRNEASTIIGYPFAENSKVTVEVDGGTKFTMFTDQRSAWIENPAQEPELIKAMQKGNRMVVQGQSRRGTITTDTYSLSGITAALGAIQKECP
ncbi:MAG: hypothetical protein GY798_25865 [Hyphomicrobiales bacterium]|nr:hypothetical protein [Hyphomicrobiales bacterium]